MSWPWRFVQLAGARKTFELAGWSAPFGRRRQDAIVHDQYRRRTSVTRYPDAEGAVTRHDFGGEHNEPYEFVGRFMDRALGKGGAEARYRELKAFVADAQPVRVTWGPFLSVVGFLQQVDHGIEAKTDITYKLTLDVDEDELIERIIGDSGATIETYNEALLLGASGLSSPAIQQDLGKGVEFTLFDAIDSAISSVTGAIGQINSIAGDIADIEKATAGQVNRLIASVNQARTAAQSLRQTAQSARADAFRARQDASSLITRQSTVTKIDAYALQILAVLELILREAKVADRARAAEQRVAVAGETWESMSASRYGTPDRANDLRRANGSRFGGQPSTGNSTNLPP